MTPRGRPRKYPDRSQCPGCDADLVDGECVFCGVPGESGDGDTPMDLVERMLNNEE